MEKEVNNEKKPGYITANARAYPFIRENRRRLLKNQTSAEELLWNELRGKKTGFKFRRQHVIDQFIVDFVCLPEKLVVEVDGKVHEGQKEYDGHRSERLGMHGFRVIRFANDEVFLDVQEVVKKLLYEIEGNKK